MPLDSSGFMLLPLMIGLFIVMAYVDIYVSKRRNQIANARYVAEMESQKGDRGLGVGCS